MKKVICIVLIFVVAMGCREDIEDITPEPTVAFTPPSVPEGEDREQFQSGTVGTLAYRILFPRHYNPRLKYPLHVFLHGIGERGNDNTRQLAIGSNYFLKDSIRENYPAFVVYPQCPEDEYWFNRDMLNKLHDLLDVLARTLPVDEAHVSVGGFSMGAYGTFSLVAAFPELFSAAVAISGDGEASQANVMARPVWQLYAGLHDNVVPSDRTERMAVALRGAGANVTLTIFPQSNHGDTWKYAFREPGFFARLFRPNKPSSTGQQAQE